MITKTLFLLVEGSLPAAMLLTNILLIYTYFRCYRIDNKKYAWCPYFILSAFAFFGVSFITLIMALKAIATLPIAQLSLALLALQFSLGILGCIALVCGAKKLLSIASTQNTLQDSKCANTFNP